MSAWLGLDLPDAAASWADASFRLGAPDPPDAATERFAGFLEWAFGDGLRQRARRAGSRKRSSRAATSIGCRTTSRSSRSRRSSSPASTRRCISIGNGVAALAAHPDQFAVFARDPAGRAPGAVEEILRFDAPVRFFLRRTDDGRTVVVLYGSANRDEQVFDEPRSRSASTATRRRSSRSARASTSASARRSRGSEGASVFRTLGRARRRRSRCSPARREPTRPRSAGSRPLPVGACRSGVRRLTARAGTWGTSRSSGRSRSRRLLIVVPQRGQGSRARAVDGEPVPVGRAPRGREVARELPLRGLRRCAAASASSSAPIGVNGETRSAQQTSDLNTLPIPAATRWSRSATASSVPASSDASRATTASRSTSGVAEVGPEAVEHARRARRSLARCRRRGAARRSAPRSTPRSCRRRRARRRARCARAGATVRPGAYTCHAPVICMCVCSTCPSEKCIEQVLAGRRRRR